MPTSVTPIAHSSSTVIDVSRLMQESYAFAHDVLSGKMPPAESAAAARHFANIAKFLTLRCKHGNIAL